MATFFFRAVAADGKVRSGRLTGDNERIVARELRKQGLTPVYVGVAPKGTSFEIKLPSFGRGRRRDVLFFTQELATLLTAGVPLDRALSITGELTEKAAFRFIVLDMLRVLKGGKSLADSLATHPDHFSDLYINMVRAGEASGALAAIFERLAEFERSRDDLRNYIISSMIYPALLAMVGLSSILILLTFVVPRFAAVFADSHLKIPVPTKIMLEASAFIQAYWWIGAAALVAFIVFWTTYTRTVAGRLWWDGARLKIPHARRNAPQGRDRAVRAGHGDPGGQHRAAGAIHRHRRRHAEQQDHLRGARGRGTGRQARRGNRRPGPQVRGLPSAGVAPADGGGRDRPAGPDVRPDGGYLRNRYSGLHQAFHRDLRAARDPGDGRDGRSPDFEHAARDYQHQRCGGVTMFQRKRRNGRRGQAGITLIEMLVVMTIIALFAALVGPSILKHGDTARITAARAQIHNFMTALGSYKLDTGTFPTTEQGLQALRVKPGDLNQWAGPYMPQDIPKDPWAHDYVYKYPGDHGDEPDIICLGADGQPGGEGLNADIVSWKSQ